MERIAVLKKSELFSDLDDRELSIVEAMCESQQVTPGTVICKQGKSEEKIYVVEDGAVAIVLEVGPMSHRQVQAAVNYESFGWSAMVEPHVCTASVRAIEKTKLLAFRGSDLRELCQNRPEIGCKILHAIARVVAKRLRQAYIQLLGVTSEE
jgi:CRP-like cAMP-binding protein